MLVTKSKNVSLGMTKFRKKLYRILTSLGILCLLGASLFLSSCQTCPKSPRIEEPSLISDLAFPTVPEVKANSASELTEAEFLSLIEYVMEAEAIFDILVSREEIRVQSTAQ